LGDIKEFIVEVTKITHLLIISVLLFYKEHKQDVLTLNEIEKPLEYIKHVFFQLEAGIFLKKRENWEDKVHKLLKFQPFTQTKSTGWYHKVKDNYQVCWRIVQHWIEYNNMQLLRKNGKNLYDNILTEVINKIIYFSNKKIHGRCKRYVSSSLSRT
jgi:hypothetical protein